MDYRLLGRTGVRVSSICLGTMAFGAEADEAEAAAMFAAARDAGVNFVDTANRYVDGRSEAILGRLLADCRDEIVLATKVAGPVGPGANGRGASRYHLVRAVEDSLRRLRTDRIDLYYIHHPDPDTPLEETLRGLDQLVRQGKILYSGLSNYPAWQTAKALGIATREGLTPVAAVQPMYNLAKRTAEIELLPLALSEGLAVMPYSPVGGGLLSGKYSRAHQPAEGRLVRNDAYVKRYGADWMLETAEAFTAVAQERGVHPVSLAVAWCGSHPAVTAPIVGARNAEQLRPALLAPQVAMTPDLRARISGLSPAPPPHDDRTEER